MTRRPRAVPSRRRRPGSWARDRRARVARPCRGRRPPPSPADGREGRRARHGPGRWRHGQERYDQDGWYGRPGGEPRHAEHGGAAGRDGRLCRGNGGTHRQSGRRGGQQTGRPPAARDPSPQDPRPGKGPTPGQPTHARQGSRPAPQPPQDPQPEERQARIETRAATRAAHAARKGTAVPGAPGVPGSAPAGQGAGTAAIPGLPVPAADTPLGSSSPSAPSTQERPGGRPTHVPGTAAQQAFISQVAPGPSRCRAGTASRLR